MKKCKVLFLIVVLSFFSKKIFPSNGDTLIVNPNPFDSVAVIQFTISSSDSIWVDIFNVTGNIIKTYYNGTVLSSGTYSLNFNGDTLPSGIYFVRLKINSTAIQSVKLIKEANMLGLNENTLFKNLQLYPNPTASFLNIVDEQNQFQNSIIEIKNYLGQVVLHTSFNSQINVFNLSEGMYFLTVQNRGNKTTIKIIKE